uniref:Ig-like domain-containing protein n=1 Tax=Periophthalmus magnuspinnatus TaxID=409849 RepID=A0A3B3ZPE3_9GOBI
GSCCCANKSPGPCGSPNNYCRNRSPGRSPARRVEDIERFAHEGGPAGVSADEESEKTKPEIVLLPEPARVVEGEIARFRCRVTGYPAPKVNWYLNGQLIRKSKRYRLRYDDHVCELVIRDCTVEDSASIMVKAANVAGESSSHAFLLVQGTFLPGECGGNLDEEWPGPLGFRPCAHCH